MIGNITNSPISRRAFLRGAGALVVSFSMTGRAASLRIGEYGPEADDLDSWLSVDEQGIVTLYSGVCELGTGCYTALLQILADELDISLAQVKLIRPDTSRTPDQFASNGSRTIEYHAPPIRQAAAEARHALLNLASAHLQVPVDQLSVTEGNVTVISSPKQCVSYAQLVGGKHFDLKITGNIKPKAPQSYRLVGKPIKRLDLPDKVVGKFTWLQDIRIPGMLHGRVVRPPAHGASVVAIDESSVEHLPGLIKVVRQADLVGVVCEREEQAIQAAQQLKITWTDWAELPSMQELNNALRMAPIYKPGIPEKFPEGVMAEHGDVSTALQTATHSLKATYTSPYHSHGSIGPSCAIADVKSNSATIWSATQAPYGLRDAVAQLLNLPNGKVRSLFIEGSGCYGQNGADDVVVDAVILSKGVGKPVRVQWMRPDEMGWETYKTARVTDVQAGLDKEGNIVAWQSTGRGFSAHSWPAYHEPRHGGTPGTLVTARLAGWNEPAIEEGFNGIALESVPPYNVANRKVTFDYLGRASHREGPIRMRTGAMRGVGAPDNVFMVESFMDELAAQAGLDPVEFRRKHLTHKRALDAIKAVTERAGWKSKTSHSGPEQKGDIARGRGFALCLSGAAVPGKGYVPTGNDRETIVASVFDVEVNRKTGSIWVKKVWVAHDCGLIINPEGVRCQIEGAVIQGISRALMEEVTFNRSTVTSRNWSQYQIARFTHLPEEIDIILIDRPELPAVGAGEAGTKNIWPGISNAVFDAIGVRLRQMPFTPERLQQEIAKQET